MVENPDTPDIRINRIGFLRVSALKSTQFYDVAYFSSIAIQAFDGQRLPLYLL